MSVIIAFRMFAIIWRARPGFLAHSSWCFWCLVFAASACVRLGRGHLVHASHAPTAAGNQGALLTVLFARVTIDH